jgi:CubicO group peptidase (beta-lactamase class C family)
MNVVKYLLVFCAVSFSIGLSAQNFSALDSIINLQINKHNSPGAVGLVIKEGKVLYDKAFGYSNLEQKIPMTNRSIFRIASQTKAVVSVAFLQLVEKGAIGLDDPIEKYFPAFSSQKVISAKGDSFQLVDRARSATIRDLLTHQSGISSGDEYPKYAYLYKKYNLDKPLNGSYVTLAEEVAQIAQMPLMHQPGERFSYGLSTNVIGALIEKISGLRLDAYLFKNIFEPLGMKDTYFYLPKNKQDRLVKLYAKNTDTSLALVPPALFNADYPLQKYS